MTTTEPNQALREFNVSMTFEGAPMTAFALIRSSATVALSSILSVVLGLIIIGVGVTGPA